ncbi:MAG: hypothetical protein ACJAUG_002684, partial [Halioglobus sp.]
HPFLAFYVLTSNFLTQKKNKSNKNNTLGGFINNYLRYVL